MDNKNKSDETAGQACETCGDKCDFCPHGILVWEKFNCYSAFLSVWTRTSNPHVSVRVGRRDWDDPSKILVQGDVWLHLEDARAMSVALANAVAIATATADGDVSDYYDTDRPLRTCPACGLRYMPRTRGQVYCSQGCWTSMKVVARGPRRTCPVCGTDFRGNRTYCSGPCRAEGRGA